MRRRDTITIGKTISELKYREETQQTTDDS
jgi:hypothetical protein